MKKLNQNHGFNFKTKQGKLFKALVLDGEVLTAAKISKRFGIKNPRATVSDLRDRGYVINTKERVAGNGVRVTEYQYSQPTREMIALAYKAQRLGIKV